MSLAEFRAYQQKRTPPSEPAKTPQGESRADLILQALLAKLEGWVQEHEFHPLRRWRFDYANVNLKLAVELEGITADGGRHQRPEGYQADCEKYNAALLEGWWVLRFTPGQVLMDEAGRQILQAIQLRTVQFTAIATKRA